MDFNFDQYHKFMEDNVLSQIGISYSDLIDRGLAFDVDD